MSPSTAACLNEIAERCDNLTELLSEAIPSTFDRAEANDIIEGIRACQLQLVTLTSH